MFKGTPPVAVALIEPSSKEKQLMSVLLNCICIVSGWEISTLSIAIQLLVSVILKVYDPAIKLVKSSVVSPVLQL